MYLNYHDLQKDPGRNQCSLAVHLTTQQDRPAIQTRVDLLGGKTKRKQKKIQNSNYMLGNAREC